MDSIQEEDHGRSGWTISVKIVQRWTCPLFKHHVLPGTGLNGGTLFATRAANARR